MFQKNVMELRHKSIASLHDLLVYEASTFTNAEEELKNVLPQWIDIATSFQLKAVLQKYLQQVQAHLTMFNDLLNEENEQRIQISKVMLTLIEETNDKLARCTEREVKDACLLESVQAINHYKISMYGTAAAFANILEQKGHADLFFKAEVNEKQLDDRLSQLAGFEINKLARTPIALPK